MSAIIRIILSAILLELTLLQPVPTPSAGAAVGKHFGLEQVAAKAAAMAGQPFDDPGGSVPGFLLGINYDQWRDIRFREEKSLWRNDGLPFMVQFFHPGFRYNRIVGIHEVSAKGVRTISYSPALFDYGKNTFADDIPKNLGFAGLRIHYRLNTPERFDELAVFVGASYFRAVGGGQVFGLSARGLAIDTGLDSGEEFPFFREFWLERPEAASQHLVLYALLDSRSLTGAYRFAIHPGKQTEMGVEGRLYRRQNVTKLGIAPLTSMFFYGENTNQRPVDDFRPEIHDSDGLLVADASGEMLWRPLRNPEQLFINSFQSINPAGYGLLQRDIEFSHYEDQEARYDLRPSLWVTPNKEWGAGHVELVQIPTDEETNDNIVAYWVPDKLPKRAEPVNFSYRLSWFLPDAGSDGLARVIATRTAAGEEEGVRKIIVDFKGGKLADLPNRLPTDSPLEAIVSAGEDGEILEKQLYRIDAEECWRLVFLLRRKQEGIADALTDTLLRLPPLEVRAHLAQNRSSLTETWSYAVWP